MNFDTCSQCFECFNFSIWCAMCMQRACLNSLTLALHGYRQQFKQRANIYRPLRFVTGWSILIGYRILKPCSLSICNMIPNKWWRNVRVPDENTGQRWENARVTNILFFKNMHTPWEWKMSPKQTMAARCERSKNSVGKLTSNAWNLRLNRFVT